MKKTRVLSLLLAACMLLALLAGCGAKEPEAPAAETPSTEGPAAQSPAPEATAPADLVLDAADNVKLEYYPSIYGDLKVYHCAGESAFVSSHPDKLVIGTVADIYGVDPMRRSNSPAYNACYDTLIRIDPVTGEFVPMLATEWEWEDELTLNITLRDGVKFSNGAPLTAEDVLFTLIRARDPKNNPKCSSLFIPIDPDASYAADDLHLVLKLTAPQPTLLESFCVSFANIYNKAAIEEFGEDAFWPPEVCGTGPYVCTEIVEGSKWCFERKDDYWGESKAPTQYLEVVSYDDVNTMFVDFETGVLDIILEVPAEQMQLVLDGQVPTACAIAYPEPRVVSFTFNPYTEALQDVRVREALRCALDLPTLTKVAFGMLGTATDSIIPNGVSYRVGGYSYEYNPEKSISLLAEAGYDKSNPLVLTFGCQTVNFQTRLAETMQAMFSEVGVELKMVTTDYAGQQVLYTGANNGGVPECDLGIMLPNVLTYDAMFALALHQESSALIINQIHDEKVQELLTVGATTTDKDAREAAYAELQQLIYDEVYTLPICVWGSGVCYHDNIKQYVFTDDRMPYLPILEFKS